MLTVSKSSAIFAHPVANSDTSSTLRPQSLRRSVRCLPRSLATAENKMLENQAGKGSNIAGSLVASDRGVTSTQKRQRRVENLLNVLVLVGGLSTISGISLLLGFVKNQNFLLFYGLAFVLALAAAGFFFKVIKRLNEKRIDHLLQEKRD